MNKLIKDIAARIAAKHGLEILDADALYERIFSALVDTIEARIFLADAKDKGIVRKAQDEDTTI